MDLEVIPRWHALTYLGCFGDVHQTSVNDGDSHHADMELEGNGVLNTHVIA